MNIKVLYTEVITKKNALEYIKKTKDKSEVDEYLDIISALNNGLDVFNIVTTDGEYLMFLKPDKKSKKS
jgi:hypothetical protein